ncbi:MAG: SUMF1/EgtB/PvdO family nonheme iron enzyme [Caldilineaceae bacterium]|nr:SUMF1/EgtB/PvdO family nonheme iron enzyme [Caldilineaceae bacterium]
MVTWDEERYTALIRSWYPLGQQFTQPRYWDDDTLTSPSQPVVGITWYEAAAYAAWLARLTGGAGGCRQSRSGNGPRRGRRLFPWGGNWDERRLNSLEGRVMGTTPVGAYPHGATPDGIYDLAGNVYEWTSTLAADYPYVADGTREDPDAAGIRIARGGGWAAVRKMVRGAYRNWDGPRSRHNDLGYRLARTLS